jgi:hypothetical protein
VSNELLPLPLSYGLPKGLAIASTLPLPEGLLSYGLPEGLLSYGLPEGR